MDEDTITNALIGALVGLCVTFILGLLLLLVVISPLFLVVPISMALGAIIMAKPEWITQMWKQKEYRE